VKTPGKRFSEWLPRQRSRRALSGLNCRLTKRSGAPSAVFSCIYTRTLLRHRFSQGSMNGLVLAMRDDISIQCGCFKPHADDFERNRPRG